MNPTFPRGKMGGIWSLIVLGIFVIVLGRFVTKHWLWSGKELKKEYQIQDFYVFKKVEYRHDRIKVYCIESSHKKLLQLIVFNRVHWVRLLHMYTNID